MPERTIKPGQGRGSRRTPLIAVGFDGTAVADARIEGVVGDVPIDQMSQPLRCRGCGRVYDGGHVTVEARYADCDRWKAPCCGKVHDSRRAWPPAMPGEHMGYVDLNEARRDRRERGPR